MNRTVTIFDITHQARTACHVAGTRLLPRDVIRLAIVAACPWVTAQWEKPDPRCSQVFKNKRPFLHLVDPDSRGPTASGLVLGYVQPAAAGGLYRLVLWVDHVVGWRAYGRPVDIGEAVDAVIRVAKTRHAEPINYIPRN